MVHLQYTIMIIVSVWNSVDLKWNQDGVPSAFWPFRKWFHRWETAKPRNVREFWQMVTENIYNLFPPKTTSPANFDRCESEALMVTSPCPGAHYAAPPDWVITVTILPGAKSPLPISKHTEFVNCFNCDPDIECLGHYNHTQLKIFLSYPFETKASKIDSQLFLSIWVAIFFTFSSLYFCLDEFDFRVVD